MRLAFLSLALAVGCSSDPDAPPTHIQSCTAAANSRGVGRPCTQHADCAGQVASVCPMADYAADLDFCTMACSQGGDPVCGDGAVCVTRGGLSPRCVPEPCAAALQVAAAWPQSQIPCGVGQVNDLGVGKVCASNDDCAGLPAARCPLTLHEGLPNWCSMLCDYDSDCGPKAFCWIRPSGVGDEGVVGSCTPTGCRIFPPVKSPCEVGQINGNGVGRACAGDAACAGFKASSCSTEPRTGCTFDCATDQDCGVNATCWHRDGVATCVPIPCQIL